MSAPKFSMAQLEALEAQGLTRGQAAERLGCTVSAIAYRIRNRVARGGLGWQGGDCVPGPAPQVSMAQIEEVERAGITMADAARKLNIGTATLWHHIQKRIATGGPKWRGPRGWDDTPARPARVLTPIPAAAPRPVLAVVAAPVTDPAPACADPVGDPADRSALVATGGRYADLRTYATARGISFTEAQRRWHALRLPLPARGR